MPGTGFLMGRCRAGGIAGRVHSNFLAIRTHQLVANVIKDLPCSCLDFLAKSAFRRKKKNHTVVL